MLKRYRTAINSCIVLLGLSLTIVAGCRKDPEPEPIDNPSAGDLKYTIEGLSDMTMERNGQVSQSLFIKYTSGKHENVTLTCVGLPKGATAKFSPVSIGIPSFNTVFTITCVRTPVGEYEISVRGSSESSDYTIQKIKLTVKPYTNAAIGLEGFFKEESACSQSGSMGDTVKIEKDTAVINRINIKGFWSGVWSNEVHATMNPNDNSLNIPVQTTNGVTFSGSGTFTDTTINVQYQVTGSTVNDNCSSVFRRVY